LWWLRWVWENIPMAWCAQSSRFLISQIDDVAYLCPKNPNVALRWCILVKKHSSSCYLPHDVRPCFLNKFISTCNCCKSVVYWQHTCFMSCTQEHTQRLVDKDSSLIRSLLLVEMRLWVNVLDRWTGY
jgi:hypothetical protein